MCNAIHWESLTIQCTHCGVAELIEDHYCRIRTVKQGAVGRWNGGRAEVEWSLVTGWARDGQRVSFRSFLPTRATTWISIPFSFADSALRIVVPELSWLVPHTQIANSSLLFLIELSMFMLSMLSANCWPPRHRSAGTRSQGSWEGPWLRSILSELNQFEFHIGDHRSKMGQVYFC